jgi:hypothetical protein
MNIFIDTNIFLSFYHLSSDDLEELRKLAVLAREGKVTLLIPNQVEDEFKRNRAGKIADAIKRMKEQNRPLQLPLIAKQYPEYAELRDANEISCRRLDSIIEHIKDDVADNNLEADAVIEELFLVAHKVPSTDKIIENAKKRMELGRPPGKKGSIGNAINWESLKGEIESGEDLYIVSDDVDYASPLDESEFDPYLKNEWHEYIKSEIYFYKRLSSFFREKFPEIKLATELEKDLLIRELVESSSFEKTHMIITKLSRLSDFTQAQINEIIAAAVTNNQIFWIAMDPDIKYFYDNLIKDREEIIDPINLKRLKYSQEELDSYGSIPF